MGLLGTGNNLFSSPLTRGPENMSKGASPQVSKPQI